MPFDITDPETKKAVEKMVADAVNAVEEPLNQKNKDLLDEVKKAKAEARKLKDIDPADLEKLESENDALKADLVTARKEAKDAAKAVEAASKALESETGFTQKLLIQDGIKSALLANGVKDEDFIDTLAAKFATTAQVITEGDARVAKIGDKAIADHIKEWAGSDAGKKFVSAPFNSGGGGSGGKGGGGDGGADLSKLSPVERITAAREAGKE